MKDLSMIKTMIKKSIGLVLSLTFALFTASNCAIRPIERIKQLKPLLATFTEDDLVVLDVDYVIMEPETFLKLLYVKTPPCAEKDKSWLKGFYADFYSYCASLSRDEYVDLNNYILARVVYELVEPEIALIIRELQSRGVRVLALTSAKAGKQETYLGGHREIILEELRYQILSKLGVTFDISFSGIDPFYLPKSEGGSIAPYFYKGILFARENKGDALKAFCEYMQWRPKKIVFVDDAVPYLQQVMWHCDSTEELYCYHYTAAYKKVMNLDHKILLNQLDYLKKHNSFLNRKEMQALMKSPNLLMY